MEIDPIKNSTIKLYFLSCISSEVDTPLIHLKEKIIWGETIDKIFITICDEHKSSDI